MSGPHRSDPRDHAAAYALGALSPEESAAFEVAMAADPELAREVAEYREVQALLDGAGARGSASAGVKARVMASATAGKTASLSSRSNTAAGRGGQRWNWALAAAALLAVVAATLLYRQGTSLESDLAANRAALDSLTAVLAEREATLATVLQAERELTVVQLAAAGPQAPGMQLFWNQRTNTAVIHAFRLAPAPAGRVYHLWLIRDGVPVPSQLFNPGADGIVVLGGVTLPSAEGVTAAAVTEEPAGGSVQPTSAILLIGTLPTS
jgi:anti-sigma-K factor RskA